MNDSHIEFEAYTVIVGVYGWAKDGTNTDHHKASLDLAVEVAAVLKDEVRCLVIDNSSIVVFRNRP